MKKLLLFLLLFFIIGCDRPIGGERDRYDCLGPAGYTWNETEKECVREWSFDDDRYQVTNFETCVMAKYLVMESYPRQCKTLSGNIFVEEIGSRDCNVEGDCIVFGEDGDCNCGCYNKDNIPEVRIEGCFCAAPRNCKCVNGRCETG